MKYTFQIILFCLLSGFSCKTKAKGFLRVEGKKIVTDAGENIILRGIGTGNWMLMEGYMMKTEGLAGTQHEFEEKLIETIGKEKTRDFYNTWLTNHFSRTDVDSMKAWGFNSIRVAMHYKWFTLPVEDEPNQNTNTWLLKGFKIIDNLLAWCSENEMYLILDLHGAPGGQGKNADISDYDDSKPSLWESRSNKDKTVALWKMLASRYSNSPWIGGYDLINETNWDFPEGNNSQLRELYQRITDAIREVDKNHIIFIEGNNFANDFTGLTPPWDDNLVYSFHKYWSGTSSSDLDWIISLRDLYNVPLWMGESGENSNTWFTDFVHLCESNNIGWSWWPVKKNAINNVLNVPINKDYEDLIRYWKGEISKTPSVNEAFKAVMKWADNHKIENCKVQYDVIDALIRQPHSDEVIPFKKNQLTQPIFFSDFDLGKNGYAYSDKDIAHYGGEWSAWNTGWGLRNDGVDIEECNDTQDITNGFNVGWTENDEWMQYSLNSDSNAVYTLKVRHASGGSGSKFHLEINGASITNELSLPSTGGWQKWTTSTFSDVIIPEGKIEIKFVIDKGGTNLNYFNLTNPQTASHAKFKALAATTSSNGKIIYVTLNKSVTSLNTEQILHDFQLQGNGNPIEVKSIAKDSILINRLIITHSTEIFSDYYLNISYSGASVLSGEQKLLPFSNLTVRNTLPKTHIIPGQIQAEEFSANNGFSLENCTDTGGGKNTSYASEGEYLDYHVHVKQTGIYTVTFRVATEQSNAEIILEIGDGIQYVPIDTVKFSSTGGWQNWETQSTSVRLEKGYHYFRILVKQGEHNLNWFQFGLLTASHRIKNNPELLLYPNPAKNKITVEFKEYLLNPVSLKITDLQGAVLKQKRKSADKRVEFDLNGLKSGYYILCVEGDTYCINQKFVIINNFIR